MFFFTGFLIGVVSLIPGISGGTILILTKKYEEVTQAITHFKNKKNRKILFLLVLGILLGVLTFARIIELFFYFAPNATIVLFSGFVFFSIPNFIKNEHIKTNIFFFFLGAFLLYFLSFSSFNTSTVIIDYPKITFPFLILFSGCGILDGIFTILPGISGSMMMMILGPYFLYKSYLANLSLHNWFFSIPLLFYFLGDVFGFYIGSKISLYFLKKHRKLFISFILGMVFMSALVLLPIHVINLQNIFFYSIILLISFILCQILNLIS